MTTATESVARQATGERRARRHVVARTMALPFAAVLLLACGGGSPTPVPTAVPTPTAAAPTASPIDVGAAFLEIVNDPDFTAKIALEGKIEMGLTAVMTGTMEGSGTGSRQTMSTTVAGVTTTTELLSIGQLSWTRTLPGPWLAKAAGSEDGLGKWLGGLTALDDLGLETKAGASLHHLRPEGGSKVPADALGLDPAQFSNPDISIELYAKEDGTPALFVFSGSWIQKVNGQDFNVALAIDMTISNVGVPITFTPPTDVWTPYTSSLGYSVAHPADFTVVPSAEGDTYQLDGVDWFYAVPYPEGKGLTAEGFRDAILEAYAADPGAPRAAPVKTATAGGVGYRMAFELKAANGTDLVIVDVLTVHGDLGWEISLVTTPSDEAADTKLFDVFLSTFKFAP